MPVVQDYKKRDVANIMVSIKLSGVVQLYVFHNLHVVQDYTFRNLGLGQDDGFHELGLRHSFGKQWWFGVGMFG